MRYDCQGWTGKLCSMSTFCHLASSTQPRNQKSYRHLILIPSEPHQIYTLAFSQICSLILLNCVKFSSLYIFYTLYAVEVLFSIHLTAYPYGNWVWNEGVLVISPSGFLDLLIVPPFVLWLKFSIHPSFTSWCSFHQQAQKSIWSKAYEEKECDLSALTGSGTIPQVWGWGVWAPSWPNNISGLRL